MEDLEINGGSYAIEELRKPETLILDPPVDLMWLFPTEFTCSKDDQIVTADSGHALSIGDIMDAFEDLVCEGHPRPLRVRNVNTGFVVCQYTPDTGEMVYPQ